MIYQSQEEYEARVQEVVPSTRINSWTALAEVSSLRKVFFVHQKVASLEVAWRLAELEQLEQQLEKLMEL